jgi:hypothetical protein
MPTLRVRRYVLAMTGRAFQAVTASNILQYTIYRKINGLTRNIRQ